jgi:hypothetical protein
MNTLSKILITVFLTFITSCTPRFNFDRIILPITPVNFPGVNTQWDDYNSAEPEENVWYSFSLFFSTNIESYGDNFDFVYYKCFLESNFIDGELQINVYRYQSSLIDSINSQYNELGPYFTHDNESYLPSNFDQSDKRFFYTSDVNGNLDIFCYYYDSYNYIPAGSSINLSGLNSEFDEGYITILPDESTNSETAYFMSDRNGSFDIYCAVSEENKLIDQSEDPVILRVDRLSSPAEDKCPFIINNLLVFASDRDGSFGGYDLWYSVYQDNEWSVPENFGAEINTEFDEFRPVIILTSPEEFMHDLMIFSSNRPGGSGRYDLYYVGVNKTFNAANQ